MNNLRKSRLQLYIFLQIRAYDLPNFELHSSIGAPAQLLFINLFGAINHSIFVFKQQKECTAFKA